MLARRLRRLTNIDPTLVQCLVFAGVELPLKITWGVGISLITGRTKKRINPLQLNTSF